MKACCRLITRKRESLFQCAQPIFSSTVTPVTLRPLSKGRSAIACFAEPWSYTENWRQESPNCQIRLIVGKSRRNLLAAPKSKILRNEYNRGDPAENNTSWRDILIPKQWKLGILQQGMNSPDENKLYFTKNWQTENEHFVLLVLEVFKSWKSWRGQEFRLEEFSIRTLVEVHFKYVESVCSGQFTLEFNQRYLWTKRNAKPRLKFAARVEYLETFLHIQKRLLRQLF